MSLNPIPVPDGSISFKLSYLVSLLCLLMVGAASAGGYRVAYLNTNEQLQDTKHQVVEMRKDMDEMRNSLIEIKQLLKDNKLYR